MMCKMKKIIIRSVKIISFVLIVALTVGALQEWVLCHADHNRQRVKGFYDEDKNSLDVVFLGASEVYSDYAPGYAYSQSGVRGYLFATQANSILNYKYQLQNILDRQNPDLVVIELNGALYGDEEEVTKEANLRNYADNVPLDSVKRDWIKQNVSDNAIEYYMPIIKYHGVWTDFPDDMKYQKTIIKDQLRGYGYLKGILNETFVFHSDQRSMNKYLDKMADKKEPLTDIEEQGLRDLLQYCKDKNLTNVVFARFPHIVVNRTFERFERANTVGDIVNEYGFDYLNFEKDFTMTGLDEEKDFYNLDHLNVYGQQKFTAFLTQYLMDNYGLSAGEPTESQKKEWETCADYYEAYVRYSESLIEQGERTELSEDYELIEKLKDYLP